MLAFRLKVSAASRRRLNEKLKVAQQRGKIQMVKRVLAVLSLADGATVEAVASILKVSDEAVRGWLKAFLANGVNRLKTKKSPGRPSKLTRRQKRALVRVIDDGPEKAGFAGACWRRSPSPGWRVPGISRRKRALPGPVGGAR